MLLILIVGLAKRKPTRRRFNLRKVRVVDAATVGALATLTLVTDVITNAAVQRMRFISLKASYAWSDLAVEDDGMSFGVAHSDYSDAEIEECLESATAIDLGDKVAQEKAARLVREIGTFGGNTDTAGGGVMFNDGKPVTTKLNWLMAPGDQLKFWMRNGSQSNYTNGGKVLINGALWVKD